jgi:hypothetical protein
MRKVDHSNAKDQGRPDASKNITQQKSLKRINMVYLFEHLEFS